MHAMAAGEMPMARPGANEREFADLVEEDGASVGALKTGLPSTAH